MLGAIVAIFMCAICLYIFLYAMNICALDIKYIVKKLIHEHKKNKRRMK